MFKPGLAISLVLSSLLLVVFAASCAGPGPGTPATTTGPTSTSSPIPSPPTTSPAEDDWPTYHRDLSRSGFDPVPVQAQNRLWTSERLDGDIYAEPLIVGDSVLAATEQDSVYCLDFGTGKTLWQVSLGTPVAISQLACGNIDPSGITGTPAADPSTGRLYVVARIQPNHHELFTIDIKTGTIVSHRSVDPPGADPRVQQQRSALALSGGRVYVAFGGLYGDCGSYYGWLVSVPQEGNGDLITFRVSSHVGAALWAPSGPAIDDAGSIYVTSGNAFSGSSFDYGSSVIRLSPDLLRKDWFAPRNWQQLDDADVDLGSMGPLLLQDGLVFQAGKEGTGYLLRASSLGQIGGEAFSAPIGQGAYGGAAYAAPYVFVPCRNGLFALKIDSAPSFKVAWSSPRFDAGPPVVAGGTVFSVDLGSGTLYAFNADNGDVLSKVTLGSVAHFTTPSLSKGRIFVAAGRQIICLGQ